MRQVIIKVLPVEKAGHTLGRRHVRRTNYSSSNLSSLRGRGHKEAVFTCNISFHMEMPVCLYQYSVGTFRQVYGDHLKRQGSQIIKESEVVKLGLS